MSDDNYKVGYGKPPRHSQFPPGTSGNRGRRKKPPEGVKQIISRISDEVVEINGQKITRWELVVRSAFNGAIKSGKTRDLKALLDLMNQYGLFSEVLTYEQRKADGDKVVAKIFSYFQRTNDTDPEDTKAVETDEREETQLVLACPNCAPALKERWKDPVRRARKKRYGCSGLQGQVDRVFGKK